ncbi:MAG: hypothetical protein J6V21_06925 [Alistipes sp.]|nr:hypothetical protein [Alistipes sp.]
MQEHRSGFAALFIALLAALAAALLLLVALVVWLADLMGGVLYPCLIVGGFMALIAIIVYNVSLRHTLRAVHEEILAISEIAKIIRIALSWLGRLI